MPIWGLTNEMRADNPWHLNDIDIALLLPAKTQTDPIHADIYWTEVERRLIDSRPFQRLRSVKQLGHVLKVYPGAEHSRFTHCLGTLRAAQTILDKVVEAWRGPHHVPSLLDEWEDKGELPLKLAEATIMARLAALLHDLTHVPFGHTIEDDLEVLIPHDKNEGRFELVWQQLPDALRLALESATTRSPQSGRKSRLYDELRAIILDKVSDEGPDSLYPFVADVVNNTICADLLDYAKRDHYFMGLPFAVGDRFMDNFFIAPTSVQSQYKEHLVVSMTRDGEVRSDVRTELLKYLRFRYEVTERALYHKTKVAYDAMLGKLLDMWGDALWHNFATTEYPQLASHPRGLDASWLREQVFELAQVGEQQGAARLGEFDARVKQELERHLTFFGDESLIDHLLWSLTEAGCADERLAGILKLVERLRYREHFKMLGYVRGTDVLDVADEKHHEFGGPAARRRLERGAAEMAGIDPGWQVILWIPSARMRLKVAEVLIEENGLIHKLAREDGGDKEAQMISHRHEELWAIRVYGPAEFRRREERLADCDVALSYLRDAIGVPMRRFDGIEVLPLHKLTAKRVRDERRLSDDQERVLADALQGHASRAECKTFDALMQVAHSEADARQWFPPSR